MFFIFIFCDSFPLNGKVDIKLLFVCQNRFLHYWIGNYMFLAGLGQKYVIVFSQLKIKKVAF